MPCVVMVLFLMFSVTFCLHDLVVLESLVYESCMSEEELDEGQIEDRARKQTFFAGHITFEAEERSLSKKVSCFRRWFDQLSERKGIFEVFKVRGSDYGIRTGSHQDVLYDG